MGHHYPVSEGWFWSARGGPRVRGEFIAETGQNAEVSLVGAVVDDPRATVKHTASATTVTYSGDPAKIVAAFAPVDLHGELDSGQLVTLLAAQNHGLITPHYVVRVAVLGALVSSDQLYSALRFRIDDPFWTAHLADGEAHAVPDDGSVLRAAAPEAGSDKGTWLVYESALPRSHQELDIRVVGGCLALARLALDQPLAVRTIEVRTSQNGEWLPLHSKAYSASASGVGESLLPREELTIERFANWIELNDRLDGLASAVDGLGQGTLQTQVLVGTSLVEGLHRRLQYEQSQFPEATGGALGRVKKAARNAAAEQAKAEQKMDPDLVHKAVMDAVGHFEEVGYRTRAQDIIDQVTSAVPQLAESVPGLADKLMAARNELAHHLVLSDEKEPLDHRINRWAAISYVTPWLLRLLLLLQAGTEPGALREACLRSNRFSFARANVAAIARDLGWLPAANLRIPRSRAGVTARCARSVAGGSEGPARPKSTRTDRERSATPPVTCG